MRKKIKPNCQHLECKPQKIFIQINRQQQKKNIYRRIGEPFSKVQNKCCSPHFDHSSTTTKKCPMMLSFN